MLFRSFIVVVLVFIGLSIPQFSKLLNLMGGSTIALLAFIFPPIFYIKLVRDEFNHKERSSLSERHIETISEQINSQLDSGVKHKKRNHVNGDHQEDVSTREAMASNGVDRCRVDGNIYHTDSDRSSRVLIDDETANNRSAYMEWPEWIVDWFITIVGIIGGVVCTYSAVDDIVDPHAFTSPCYMNFTYNCCG